MTIDPEHGKHNPSDNYGIHDDNFVTGGLTTVKTLAERDSLPNIRRSLGMEVFVEENNTTYKLTSNDTWEERTSGSEGATDTYHNLTPVLVADVPVSSVFVDASDDELKFKNSAGEIKIIAFDGVVTVT